MREKNIFQTTVKRKRKRCIQGGGTRADKNETEAEEKCLITLNTDKGTAV